MGQTLRMHVVNEFTVEECCQCGVAFAMTTYFHERALEERTNFFCPNGHPQRYVGKSEAEMLREQLKAAREGAAFAERQAELERNRTRAVKGHLTRARKRAAAGTCPCCKRTFKALSEHMRKQHPEFVEEHQS